MFFGFLRFMSIAKLVMPCILVRGVSNILMVGWCTVIAASRSSEYSAPGSFCKEPFVPCQRGSAAIGSIVNILSGLVYRYYKRVYCKLHKMEKE